MHREPGTLRRLLMDTGIWVWNVLNIWWLHGALYIQICENNYYIHRNECDDHHWKYQGDNIIMYRGLYWKIQKLRKKVHAHFYCVCVMFLYKIFVMEPVVFVFVPVCHGDLSCQLGVQQCFCRHLFNV